MLSAVTPVFKVFMSGVLPLAALCCLWFAVLFFCRGGRMLLSRGRAMVEGLHACSAVYRHGVYIPLFNYTSAKGDEVDILGDTEYPTEQEAMQARRPLVYESERPDAAVARNSVSYILRPVMLLLCSLLLLVVCHYLLVLMPD